MQLYVVLQHVAAVFVSCTDGQRSPLAHMLAHGNVSRSNCLDSPSSPHLAVDADPRDLITLGAHRIAMLTSKEQASQSLRPLPGLVPSLHALAPLTVALPLDDAGAEVEAAPSTFSLMPPSGPQDSSLTLHLRSTC